MFFHDVLKLGIVVSQKGVYLTKIVWNDWWI